jgi:O-acetyl-ADP-ribose deacetylase
MNEIIIESFLQNGSRIQIVQGDITDEQVDAIVNAANSHLQHGGGVAGAILRKGGEIIQQESNEWVKKHGPVTHIKPAYTSCGGLPCRAVIHGVGPVWGEGDEDAKLSKTVIGVLKLAESLDFTSVSLPAISTGIYGFPKDRAARVTLQAVLSYFKNYPEGNLNLVRLALYDQGTLDAFVNAWGELGVG